MPSIVQHPKGFRAHVFVGGSRRSKLFKTSDFKSAREAERAANKWAYAAHDELESFGHSKTPDGEKKTLKDAFDRYVEEVSSKKRGGRWEKLRLNRLERDAVLPMAKPLGQVSAADIVVWRDQLLGVMSSASVLRYMNILGDMFEVAIKEWCWIRQNPMRLVRKPRGSPPRDRIIQWGEVKRMLRALGHVTGSQAHPNRSVSQSVALAFLFAIRSGMRAGEICGLTRFDVSQKKARLPITKNGSARDVPLTGRASLIVEKAMASRSMADDRVFGLSKQSLDALFRRAREKAGLSGFTFHDSRHTAATMIVRQGKLGVAELCSMFGWRDPKKVMVYFNPTAEELADRLDA